MERSCFTRSSLSAPNECSRVAFGRISRTSRAFCDGSMCCVAMTAQLPFFHCPVPFSWPCQFVLIRLTEHSLGGPADGASSHLISSHPCVVVLVSHVPIRVCFILTPLHAPPQIDTFAPKQNRCRGRSSASVTGACHSQTPMLPSLK